MRIIYFAVTAFATSKQGKKKKEEAAAQARNLFSGRVLLHPMMAYLRANEQKIFFLFFLIRFGIEAFKI